MKRSKNSSLTSAKGFAIIEALVAFIVLGVGLLALLNFNNAAIQSTGDTKVRQQAIDLAQDKVQELRSFLDNDEAAGGDWNSRMANGNDTKGSSDGLAADFTRTWTVDTATDPLIAAITVQISWTDRNNQQQTYTIDSDVYDVDPKMAASVLHTAIVGLYDPAIAPGNQTDQDNPEVVVPNSEPESGPFTVTADANGDGTPETGTYNYRLTISGEVDKKTNQNVSLPNPQVSADFAAVCDFGNTAG